MSTGTVRALDASDTDDISRLASFDGLTRKRLAEELGEPANYRWWGLHGTDGTLHAVHRSMRWGRHLLLKGVVVDEAARGSNALLRLAFALRDAARDEGFAGVAAWVEPYRPEAALARLLRLRQSGPLVHRFQIPLLSQDEQLTGAGAASSGVSVLATVGVVTPDLLANPAGAGQVTVSWGLDGRRLVLSACPCPTAADLPELAERFRPLASSLGADSLEVPVPGGDLLAALVLAGRKARRLSRTAVRLGRLDFRECQC